MDEVVIKVTSAEVVCLHLAQLPLTRTRSTVQCMVMVTN